MSAHESQPIEDIAADAASAALDVTGLVDKWAFFRGLSAGTATLEGSVDGTNWRTIQAVTEDGDPIEIPAPWTHLRITGSGLTLTECIIRGLNRNRL